MAKRKVYLGATLINDTYVGLDKTNLPSTEPFLVDYVFAGAGGGGGAGGAGGGGGEVQTNYFTGSQLALVDFSEYYIEIGAGGEEGGRSTSESNPGAGKNGGNTFISASVGGIVINALGGGGGGGTYISGTLSNLVTSEKNGKNGGTGGGGALLSGTGGSATGSGYGLDGGDNSSQFAANTTCSALTGSVTPSALAKQNSAGGGGQIIPTDGFNVGAATRLPFTGSNGAIWFDCFIPSPSISDDQWPQGGQGGDPYIIPWVKTATSEIGAGGGGGWTMTQRVGNQLPLPVNGYPGEGGGTTGGDGGGRGTNNLASSGNDGAANSGAGGGGGALTNSGVPAGSDAYSIQNGGTGGSGVAVIRYPQPQRYTGGNVTIEDGYVYHTFLSSSTLQPL